MATYLRRMLVPMSDLAEVLNQVKANYTQQVMTDTITVGGTIYGVVKAVSDVPLVAWVPTTISTTIGDVPGAPAQTLARSKLYASDLDLKAVISDDFDSASYASKDGATVTYTITDPDGQAATIEIPVVVADDVSPVITAADVDVSESAVSTWTPTGTATDVGDGSLTSDLVITYAESDNTPIADLAAFRTHLGTLSVGGTAKVIYNVSDAAGNDATEVEQIVTVIAD
jgi:hypothetical protein